MSRMVKCRCCGVLIGKRPTLKVGKYYTCSESCRKDVKDGIVYWHKYTFPMLNKNLVGIEKPERQTIRPELRFRIFTRDGFKCQYCGMGVKDGIVLHVDHVVPNIKVKDNNEYNLITSCSICNLGKGDIELPENLSNEILRKIRYENNKN